MLAKIRRSPLVPGRDLLNRQQNPTASLTITDTPPEPLMETLTEKRSVSVWLKVPKPTIEFAYKFGAYAAPTNTAMHTVS